MSKKRTKKRRSSRKAFLKIAKTFAGAMSRSGYGYGLHFPVTLLRDSGFPKCLEDGDLLIYLRECGLAQDDGNPAPLALKKGLMYKNYPSRAFRHDGSFVGEYFFTLTGLGVMIIVASLIAARKEEQA